MSFTRYFVQILSLSAAALAVDNEEASLVAWKAYGDIIKSFLTGGQPITKGQDFIYIAPPTSVFVRGGTVCPESVTNFELYNVADRLQNSSSPLLGTTGPLYHQALESYLESVAVSDRVLTDAEKKKLATLEKAVDAAKTKFSKQKNTAFMTWRKDEVAQYFNQSFQAWVTDNDPQYANFQAQLVTADASYNNYMLSLYGSKYNLLQEQRTRINGKAQNELSPVPGYNMMVYPSADSYAVSLKPWIKNEITDFVAYRPSYSLAGYENTCDAYFRNNLGRTTLEYSFKNVDGHDWSTFGYEKRVVKGGGGFFGILGYKQSSTSETTHYNSWSGSWQQDVKVTISMKGSPALVPINAGFWDVGNVRQTYPKLRAGESDTLAGNVRLTHALVGYQIAMNLTFSNQETWKNVTQFIETGKKSKAGGLQVFGFSFGASGGGSYQYTFNDLKTSATSDGGVISIPPTPEGMMFMLGARGKAL
ncbi:hypothetical protein M011DRAFT_477265 [Sporormia fimetaria CBS 119925]|uniref:Uncharacterized protein n=1 Tax=Sporormia fimetaria CBS 119925 TaxID=1340428 RepID=A0A6A6VEW6_9PLEO|nr:hypothetical protein M011DRAFT_477265 [Sporormia fimetaria CBS 119925]